MTMDTLSQTHISIFLGNTPAGLRISNLPSDLTKNVLKDICKEYGTITRLNFKIGRSFAFVHYNQKDAACKAKSSLHGFPLGENILTADLLEDQEDFAASGQKSDNLQYNTVIRWVDGAIVLLSDSPMLILINWE